jgi:hypothetical protein
MIPVNNGSCIYPTMWHFIAMMAWAIPRDRCDEHIMDILPLLIYFINRLGVPVTYPASGYEAMPSYRYGGASLLADSVDLNCEVWLSYFFIRYCGVNPHDIDQPDNYLNEAGSVNGKTITHGKTWRESLTIGSVCNAVDHVDKVTSSTHLLLHVFLLFIIYNNHYRCMRAEYYI